MYAKVDEDISIVLQVLGHQHNDKADLEKRVANEVYQLFESVKDKTWSTGRQNNRTP